MSGNQEDSSSDDDCYGPALPPHLLKKDAGPDETKKSNNVIGPQLPAHITRDDLETLAATQPKSKRHGSNSKGAKVKDSDSDQQQDEEDEVIGPYLPDDPRSQLVPKSQPVKPKETTVTKREEWMLICPKERSLAVGLGPRKFLGRTPDELTFDDADEDEDDNQDKFLEKARADLANKAEQETDLHMELLMTGSSETKESLLSIHRKRKLLEQEKSSEPKERRPFDRDVDLKVGGLTKEDKDKFIKKSEELTSRFHGGKKKYL